MPPVLRPPTEDQLPPGDRRRLVMAVWALHRRAGRLPLNKIVTQIGAKDRRGTASQETIRKVLLGKTVPGWLTLLALLEALAELAEVDLSANAGAVLDDPWTTADPWPTTNETLADRFRHLWDKAVDELPPAPAATRPPEPSATPRIGNQSHPTPDEEEWDPDFPARSGPEPPRSFTARTGEVCPISGVWTVAGQPTVTAPIAKGNRMPPYGGGSTTWSLAILG